MSAHAVQAALAVLKIPKGLGQPALPPIEALFTADEETTQSGGVTSTTSVS
jgi:hypothetical protein